MNLDSSADIRFLNMEQDISFSENEELKNPEWIKLDENNYIELSTIGCIFGQILAENTDVPVGIIKNYRGGNSIISFPSEKNIGLHDKEGIFKREYEREKKN